MNYPSWRFALICLSLAGLSAFSSFARPRQPLPPLPESAPVLSRMDFDEPLRAGLDKAGALQAAYGDWVESGSGYALRRGAASVQPMVPYLLPGVDASGRTNFAGADGALRFWFKPEWSSASVANGAGPGHHARLLELTVVGAKDALVIWSLNVSPDGATLFLTGVGESGATDLLQAPLAWQAGDWHLVALNYGPKGCALFLDGEPVAVGSGVPAVPPAFATWSVGSTVTGAEAAGGEFDELTAFARPLAPMHLQFHYETVGRTLALGPVTPAEDQARRAAAVKRLASPTSLAALSLSPSGGGAMASLMSGLTISIPVFTNQATNLFFTLQNTETDAAYEILWSTNLPATAWTSVARGATNQVDFFVPAPVPAHGFYQARGPLCIFAPTPFIAVEDVLSPLTNLTLTGFAGFNGTLHCSVTNGRLWLLPTNGLTFLNSTNGTTSLTVTGAFTNLGNALSGLLYLGKTNSFGQDRLTLVLTNAGDGGVLSDRLVNSITVLPVNDPPYAPSETYYVTSGVWLPAAQGLLHNATDPDGDYLVVFAYSTNTALGYLTMGWDGSIWYFAHDCYNVSETFTFQIIDNYWDGYLFWRKSPPISFTVHATVPQYLPYTILYAPTNGEVVVQGLNLDITAYADPSWCNELSQVKFFAGTNLIGTVSNGFVSPPEGQQVSMIWSNVPPGTHALSTLAMTTTGLSWTSSVVTITATLLPNGDVDGDGMTNAVDPFPYDFYNAVVPSLAIVGGNDQAGPTGAVLANPLQVLVTTAAGVPLTNAPITFVSVQGGGLIANPAGGGYSSSVLVRSGTTGHAAVLAKAPTTVSTFGSITATASASTGDRLVSFLTAATNQVSGGTSAYLHVFTPLK